MNDVGRRRGGGPGAGAPPPALTLAIEVDGLLHRFGRIVPDTAALITRIADLAPQGGTLDLHLVRFGSGDEAGLGADLEALGVVPAGDRPAFRSTVLGSAAELSRLGDRTMLLGGRAQSVRAALARLIPAYLVSDRRLPDHRQLPLHEAERTIAEALRVPVPRPMSDESRTGTLVALRADTPAAVRMLGRQLLDRDPHADWVTIAPFLVVYVEREDAAAWLIGRGGECLAEGIGLDVLGLAPAADGATALLNADPWQLSIGQARAIPWARIRRSRLGGTEPPLRRTAGLSARKDPAPVTERGTLDGEGGWSLALPFEAEASETIVALVDSTPGAQGQASAATTAVARALRARGSEFAMLLCAGSVKLDSLLWNQEESRIRAVIAFGDGDAADGPAEEPFPAPLRIAIDPGNGGSGDADAAAERICRLLDKRRS